MKKYFLFIVLSVVCAVAKAQDAELDSLLKVLKTAPEDTNKVNALIEASAMYRNYSLDTAIYFAQEAKVIAEKIDYNKGVGYALKATGLAYNVKSDYVNALHAWKQALDVFQSAGIKVGEANMLNNIGVIYYNKSLETEALDYYLRSLKVSEEIKDTLRIATALINLGAVYSNKSATYQKSIDFHRKALQLGEVIDDKQIIGTSMANVGEIFYRWKKYDSALFYLQNSTEILQGTTDNLFSINIIGKDYLEKREFDIAIK